ncbi:acid phosphatase (class A) [Silvimonas terrae]|uniref:Acid phosphatase n=1 Tax=Silvimonas terrae TaxID=300266 RepID=A0A840RMG5_9NEIS|nr:phosphatase PAP2 family protein [Silvimonas terrae]MBB5193680.1 acid phosphatase (class A) [Silvimonas terrae]
MLQFFKQLVVPVTVLLLATTPTWAADATYLGSTSPDLVQLLPPPPALGTPAGDADLQQVLLWQKNRTDAQLKLADADTHKSVFRFNDVLGSAFDADKLPLTAAFFTRIAKQGAVPMKAAKAYWKRPRPYNSSTDVHPGIVTEGTSPSYPSGHATFAWLTAEMLAQMVPEKRAEIFNRADSFALGRVIGGVHYPSDIEAGKASGMLIAAAMLQNPALRADLQAATNETRKALALPALTIATQTAQ